MATLPASELAVTPAATTPLPYRVTRRRRENAGTWTLELEPAGAAAIAPLAPGQFTMLYAFGVGEVPISASAVRPDGTLVHTIRSAGAVTRALCAAAPGDVLGVRGPLGHGWPLDAALGRDVVLVAGGVGLPPLRPALHHVLAHRHLFGNVVLLYGGRTPGDLLFRRDLERWRSHLDVTVDVTVDSAGPEWRGRVGLVTKLVPRAPFDPSAAVAFVCGPEAMMWYAAEALVEAGVDAADVHVSLERTMRCGIGLCGHCQLGTTLVCRDGPVYPFAWVRPLMAVEEL